MAINETGHDQTIPMMDHRLFRRQIGQQPLGRPDLPDMPVLDKKDTVGKMLVTGRLSHFVRVLKKVEDFTAKCFQLWDSHILSFLIQVNEPAHEIA